MAVRMRKVLARPWVGVRVCHLLLLMFYEELCRSTRVLSAQTKGLRRITPSEICIFSYHTKAEFNNCLTIYSIYFHGYEI